MYKFEVVTKSLEKMFIATLGSEFSITYIYTWYILSSQNYFIFELTVFSYSINTQLDLYS